MIDDASNTVMDGEPKVNILVVDDQGDKLLVYRTVLADLGENIITANSGEEALKLMLHTDFAVVLLDVNMPVMDGFETAALIRGRKTLAHTPIIFVTAFGDEMHTAQGYSLGAVDYILAPIVPDVLRTKVKVFVQLFRMTAQIKRQAEDRVQLAREQTARAAAELANRRTAFLADISRTLSSSLDFNVAGLGLTRLVVPFLADLCALSLVDEQAQVRDTMLAWEAFPQDQPLLKTASVTQLLDADINAAIARALHSTSHEDVTLQPSCSALMASTHADPVAPLQLDFTLARATVFPLLARGRKLGALVLGFSTARAQAPEIALAAELAERVAIALDNALLYSAILDADRRKDEFLAMLAHELRNPLAPIRNAVEIMRLRDAPGSAPDEVCEVIAKEVSHLSRLVDDLLDVSRINRGKINLKQSPLDLAALLSLAIESKRDLLDAHGLTLLLSMPATPLWVRSDPVRITQVIVNLLDNAAKFTPEGGKVWVHAKEVGHHCELRVRDSGIGISPKLLPEIFNLFTQGECTLDRRQGGLGIGLALVKDLVEMHGGTVQASSAGVGRGSEFVVRLPLLEDAPAALAEVPTALANGAVQQRILIVDDHVDSATTLAILLGIYGHNVKTAHSGIDALQLAARFRPRCAVLDIGLPGMDGYELAAQLREMPETRDTTLIAVTGYGQPEDQRRSAAAGFHHHLVKPVEPEILQAIISNLDQPHPSQTFNAPLASLIL